MTTRDDSDRCQLTVDTRHPAEYLLVDLRGAVWAIDPERSTWVRADIHALRRLVAMLDD